MSFFKSLISRISVTLQSQIAILSNFFIQFKNIGTRATQLIQRKAQHVFQAFLREPQKKEDYLKIFGIYFSKQFVCTSLTILGVLVYFVVFFAIPWAEGKVWAANLNVDTSKYSSFTGRAKVHDQTGVLVFEGALKNGLPEGEGTQYDSKGNIIYKGNFSGGKYSGEGELYNSDKVLIYSGAFENNKYQGNGKLYNNIGKVIYVGDFAVGLRSGKGIEYDPDTVLKKYYGEYSNDVPNGNGVKYEDDGINILYEGGFKDGNYGGEGKLYSHNALQYSGNFENGIYSGIGNLYNTDTGALIYSGEFKDGLYDGAGTLYDPSTEVMIYSGDFSKGKRQGSGKSYDKLGSQLFDGNFRGDSIDYIAYLGKSPDDVTKEFGQETYKTEVSGKMIITYLNLDASIVFKIDEEKGEYTCEKIILGIKEEFMGLGAKSTAVERRNVMGDPFSSINYTCPDYYKTVFSNLGININNIKSIPCDKYVMDNYFVRFYFNEGRTELKCIEICSM